MQTNMTKKRVWSYDLESYPNCFLAGFYNPKSGKHRIFEISDRMNNSISLYRFLTTKVSGLIGFNNLSYDSHLINYFLRTKVKDPKRYYNISQRVIATKYSVDRNPLIPQLDYFKILHFDNKAKRTSLKYCEFGLRMKNVQDLPYDFRKNLRNAQIDYLRDYLIHDLEATTKLAEVYADKTYLRKQMKSKFGIECKNFSDSKLGEELLLKLYCDITKEDPDIISKQRTYIDKLEIKDILSPYLHFENDILKGVYEQVKNTVLTKNNWQLEIKFDFNDQHYKVGLGGIHSSDRGIWKATKDLLIDDRDVGGYYPSLIINLGICPQHLNAKAFAQVIKEYLVEPRAKIYKPKSKDKTLSPSERKLNAAFSDGLKLAANSVSGKLKDKYSFCYSPDQNVKMTLNGQLSLLMLIDMIWKEIPDIHILQSNTDGFTMTYHPSKKPIVDKICKQWEEITNLVLEDAYPNAIYQRDVNNYIWDFGDYQKLKGAYEIDKKVGNELILNKNSSKRIVPIAAKEYFINGTPVEETITNHKDIFDFYIAQKANKNEGWYFKYQVNPSTAKFPLNQVKVLRYYVSTKGGIIWKCNTDGREAYVEAWPSAKERKQGKHWKLRLSNKHREQEDYNIDYSYYIREAQKLINKIER
jgi:hypothetical protein